MRDRPAFYDSIRPLFGGSLSGSQVSGMEAILNEWMHREWTDVRCLAYMLATAYHETAKTMQPIEEYGKGKGKLYGHPDKDSGEIYFGRGFVQLTWAWNYKNMGAIIGADLYKNPSLALDLTIAVKILFEGMTRGVFTGKKLKDYFNDSISDPVSARRIINGLDRAELVAKYYWTFYYALT